MKWLALIAFFCAGALSAPSSPAGRPANAVLRLPGFASCRAENVPTLADVLPAEIAARKLAGGGNVVASVETLANSWKLKLLRFQEWDYALAAWVDFERDSSIYDENGRLALMSAQWIQQGVWMNYYRFLYSYDAAGNLEQFVSQSWYEEAWLNYVKYVYTYDAQNRQLSFTHIKWFSGDWQNVRRFSYAFDEAGNESQDLLELWGGAAWVGANRTSFEYDSLSRRINAVSQTWADTVWVNTQHDSTSYNEAGLPATMITQMWQLVGKLWQNYTSTVVDYNLLGGETVRVNRFWVDTVWVDTTRVVSAYDPQGHLLSASRQAYDGSQWRDDSHDLYAYDAFWNVTSFVTQSWSGSAWLNTIQYVYTYDEHHNRLTELSQRFDGVDWLNKSLNTRAFDAIGNMISEIRQVWSGYYWTSIARYLYSFEGPTQAFDVQAKWNIVSVPLTVSDYTKTAVFPTATSEAFAYDHGYVASPVLEHGRAYWMKFPTAQSITFMGVSRSLDTIDVAEGWNMIGSLSTSIPVANIGSIPDSIVTGSFYGYGGGFQPSGTLDPARGYWVKVEQAGRLVLDGSLSSPPANRIRVRDTGETPPPPPDASALSGNGGPTEYQLDQNYPNPFNPSTTVSYALRTGGRVDLRVYDLLGRVVAVLAAGRQDAGMHSVTWNASDVPSGIYFYRLTSGSYVQCRKLLLLR
jgi:hypothetical protein